MEKVAPKFWLLLYSVNCPRVNNHPMGENWPNLVTLLTKLSYSTFDRRAFKNGADKLKSQTSKKFYHFVGVSDP
jgi:hypothetical protein